MLILPNRSFTLLSVGAFDSYTQAHLPIELYPGTTKDKATAVKTTLYISIYDCFLKERKPIFHSFFRHTFWQVNPNRCCFLVSILPFAPFSSTPSAILSGEYYLPIRYREDLLYPFLKEHKSVQRFPVFVGRKPNISAFINGSDGYIDKRLCR